MTTFGTLTRRGVAAGLGLLGSTAAHRQEPAPDAARVQARVAPALPPVRAPDSTAPAAVASPDLPQRDTAVHWPRGYDPATAQSFAHNALVIAAPCARVWTRLVDARRWPEWYVLAKDVRVVGPGGRLASGARIRWSTFGFRIESRIAEFVPGARLGWHNDAPTLGPANKYYQTWLLTPAAAPAGAGCRVVTEEVGLGPYAAAATRAGDVGTHRAHDLWLASLRWAAEADRPGPPPPGASSPAARRREAPSGTPDRSDAHPVPIPPARRMDERSERYENLNATRDLVRAVAGDRLRPGAETFVDQFADDGVFENPFLGSAESGGGLRLAGRAAIAAHMRGTAAYVYLEGMTVKRVHALADPGALVVEYDGRVRVVRTGQQFVQSYVGVLEFRGGRVALFREYINSRLAHDAFARDASAREALAPEALR